VTAAEIDENKNPKQGEAVPSMEDIEVKSHRERAIPPGSVRGLYDHVGWRRPGSEEDIAEVLAAGPTVGAWDEDRLVGFARALSDGRFAAYVEDVMVHERWQGHGLGDKVMARLLEEPVLRAAHRPLLRRPRFRVASEHVLMHRGEMEV
jgi:GNAT superfamily N-acetyltransferase